MKEKVFLILIIISLFIINCYALFYIYYAKSKDDVSITNEDELNTYKSNFKTNILNSNLYVDNFNIKDTINNNIQLKEAFDIGQDKILVCRFSQMHCESCVNSCINILKGWTDSIGINNIVFLGNHRNNRIFRRTIPLYGIQYMNVYNVENLNIPVEELKYPYFFVLHNNLKVSDVFVPDKGTPHITNIYLENISKIF